MATATTHHYQARQTGILVKTRSCTVCKQLIPPVRLRAIPNARLCTRCLESAGDVPMIRRVGDVDFVSNKYLEDMLYRATQRVYKESYEQLPYEED